jgi:outer membrane receptor for Fe3+-dicitrate
MKLKVINERLLRKIVKVSLAQIAMFLIFTNVTMAKSEKEDKTVLSKVESSANVLKKTFLAADIKGTVSDDKGEKLPGVNVIIKGTSRGTSTNANGEFSLSNVNNNDVLVLTYVGYESQEIQINNKTDFSIVLKTDAKALDEVVVVGYGTQKRSNITGSISTIKAADLSKVQSPSFDNALQGKSPGVYVSSNGGQPGGGIAVRIRGVGAINNSNPLYIIDGIQRDPGNNENANPLASINSNDIDRKSVV